MNEVQLSSMLITDEKCARSFIGTYPSNKTLPQAHVFPCCYIINTAPSFSRGQHWYALFLTIKDCGGLITADIFDSLGERFPLSQAIKISLYGMRVTRNKHKYQDPLSQSCGLFSVYYIKMRCHGLDNITVLKTLQPGCYTKNEEIIHRNIPIPS
jgi:hypothetical protein